MANSFGGLWDNEKCFNWEIENRISLDNEGFVNLYNNTAREICKLISFDSFGDIGGGVGAYSLAMKNLNKEVYYYDLNEYHLQYAQIHNVATHYKQTDITQNKIKHDLVACIEVMEHITDDKLNDLLNNVDCKYFHFSSTPNKTDFDEEWGHINIKKEDEWIALFERHNYQLHTRMNLPTNWSLLFKKS
jgi:2-polyprenyl-3-methyl-5-hydroxy-6-metoxy-1,4-benzoquinol methylase